MGVSGMYNVFKEDLFLGDVDLVADVVKIALYDTNHSFSAADTIYTNTNELAATGGYSTGGNTLASKTVSGTTTQAWDAADTEWTSATFEAFAAVIYDTSNTNSLIATIDFGGGKQVTSGTFTIQFDVSGIITLETKV